MHRVVELHVVVVAPLQEVLRIRVVFADRGGLPAEAGAGGVDLEELGAVVVVACNQARDAERPHTARLRVLLHKLRALRHHLRDGLHLAVGQEVLLCGLAGVSNYYSEVRAHASEHEPRCGCDVLNLLIFLCINQNRCDLPISCNDDSVLSFNAQRHFTLMNPCQRIFNLHELAALVESRQREVHVTHLCEAVCCASAKRTRICCAAGRMTTCSFVTDQPRISE
mmetsp:Transcript_138/g.291  ORF Transcript_138/g.291 Transcript_138/m.291 type:complete len:224 (+) Transcript_138:290-961(+)